MDEREARKVQREASEALLDLGVSLPLKEWRLPFMKRPVRWRVTMRRPRLAGQICIVRLYLSMGVSPEEVSAFAGCNLQIFLCLFLEKLNMPQNTPVTKAS